MTTLQRFLRDYNYNDTEEFIKAFFCLGAIEYDNSTGYKVDGILIEKFTMEMKRLEIVQKVLKIIINY